MSISIGDIWEMLGSVTQLQFEEDTSNRHGVADPLYCPYIDKGDDYYVVERLVIADGGVEGLQFLLADLQWADSDETEHRPRAKFRTAVEAFMALNEIMPLRSWRNPPRIM